MDQDDPYTRIDDLWFPDGTLILRAETTIFRVTRSILAARSTVFRDMVAFPQPIDVDLETIDECPVVYLHDSAADVEALLRAIFDSSYFMPVPEPVELSVVLGILRLSHKYDIQYLYRRALRHLEAQFYHTTVESFQNPATDHIVLPPGNKRLGFGHLLAIIDAAVQVGALWLLPIAYHEASQSSCGVLLKSISPENQAVVHQCILGGQALSQASADMSSLFISPVAGCTSPQVCSGGRFQALGWYFIRNNLEVDTETLRWWTSTRTWQMISDQGLCAQCLTGYKEKLARQSALLWIRLPHIFDLPNWQELGAQRAATMG